ncbi:MAG: hypothetical protein JNM63_05210 [Spirochaetia bacterium]|nr:hypothetical protein [Spirochaetia bacterium]
MVKVFTYSKDEEKEALEYLKHNDPLERELFQDLEVLGYSGDDLAKIVLYVAVTSRKLDKPLSVLSVANSSAGKSFGQEVISSLVPDDELFSYTRLSPRSLSHFGKYDLQNKALFLDEFVGSEDESSSQLRSLLSRGHITTGYSTMDSMTGKVQTINKDVFGPIALLSSATNENRIDDETRSRFMILPVDESQEQTARVMASMIERNTERGVLSQGQRDKIRRKYQMFQKVLRPVTVVLPDPWANKIQFNSERISQKRRFQGYLSFLYAVALHRQFQKDVKVLMTPSNEKVEVIVVDRRDILLTNSVMSRLYGAGSQDLNPVNRKMLLDIQAFCDVQGKQAGIPPGEITFTRRDIRESGRWDAVPCRRAFEKLLELEYIEKSFGHKRARHFYRLAPGNSPGNSGDSGSALWCPE